MGYESEWLQTVYEGIEVNERGEVRSWRRRNGRGPLALAPHLMRPQPRGGYLRVQVARGACVPVHHLVLSAFVGPCPPDMEARHLNDEPLDNHLTNLRWGTRIENCADKAANGRERHGEAKPSHRLTVVQVSAIRADPRSSRVVGADYGVSHSAIQRIRRGERWRRD